MKEKEKRSRNECSHEWELFEGIQEGYYTRFWYCINCDEEFDEDEFISLNQGYDKTK